jgi:hypothetical protein
VKKSIKAAIAASLALVLGSGIAAAQEEEAPEALDAAPVEAWACDYNDGMGPSDLDKVIDEWNDWMDDQGQMNYFAATLTPVYFGERNFDIAWLGAWTDGHAMGSGTDLWITEGRGMQARFFEVLNCSSHTSFVSLNVKEPQDNDGPPSDTFVLNFSNCSFEEDKEFSDYLAAQNEWNAYADEIGLVGGTWIWFPIAGETDDSYDFKAISSAPDFTTYGANWQLFMDGHFRKSNELFGDILDCDISRTYHATVLRRIASDDD